MAGSNCGADGCFNRDAATDGGSSDVSTDIGNDALNESGGFANPLCGVLLCNPDDPEATKCNSGATDDGGTPDSEAGADAADAQDAGVEASMAPDSADDAMADADEDGTMGGSMGGQQNPADEPTPDDAPAPGDPPSDDEAPPQFACQVTVSTYGERLTTCVPGGDGVHNDPCVTSADCAAGFACVGDETAGVCRSYCCLDPEACGDGTYCSVRTSRDALQDDPDADFGLPVCVPADDCELLPGLDGENRCAEDRMCAVVRDDGTTACVEPGVAGEGEPCGVVGPDHSPCAEGFVCSKSTNTCLALCRINTPDSCNGGVCQGGTGGLPEAYGVCVGARD